MFLYVHKNSKTHDDQRNKFFQIEFLCILCRNMASAATKLPGDPKKTWQIINQIREKFKKVIKPQFLINNEKVIQRRVIANEFNKYFVSLASKQERKRKIIQEKNNNFYFTQYII